MQIDDCSVHFSYEGDLSEVTKWIPQVKQTFRQIRKQGLTNHYKKLSDSVELFVQYIPPKLGRIRIKAGQDNLAHGLCSLHLDIVNGQYKVDKVTGVKLLQFKGSNTASSEKDQLSLNLPSIKGTKLFLGKSYSSTFNSYSYDTEKVDSLVDGDILGRYPQELNNSPFFKLPGKFTGEMRKVVQMILGMGGPIGFEHGFTRTHGIYVSSTGTRYVIEIGNRGIFATPLKCTKLDGPALNAYKEEIHSPTYDLPYKLSQSSGLMFTDDDNDFFQLLSKGTVRQLASSADMSDFYGNAPYFDDCGWAFNIYGKEAQNTCWTLEPKNDPNYAPNWVFGKRYKIIFTEGADGWPKLGSISLVDSGYLYGNTLSWWVPGNFNTLIHFDIFLKYFIPPPGPIGTSFYVFYDGETEKIAGFKPEEFISSESDSYPYSGVTGLVIGVPANYSRWNGNRITRIAQEVYVGSPKNHLDSIFSGGNATTWSSEILSDACWRYDTGSFYGSPHEGVASATIEFISGDGFGDIANSVGIIPANDRECILIYSSNKYLIPSGSTIESRTGFGPYAHSGYTDIIIDRLGNNWAQFVPAGWTEVATQTITGDVWLSTSLDIGGVTGINVITSRPSGRSDDPDGSGYGPVSYYPQSLNYYLNYTATEDIIRNFQSQLEIHASGNIYQTIDTTLFNSQLGNLTFENGYTDPFISLWYQSVPDAFTNSRLVSYKDNASSYIDMLDISGKALTYRPCSDDTSRWKFYFGVP